MKIRTLSIVQLKKEYFRIYRLSDLTTEQICGSEIFAIVSD